MNESSRPSLRTLVWFGLLCVLFAAVWFQMPGHAFFSPDEGGKFLQMQGMGGDPFRSCRIIYPGIGKDPALFYYPSRAESLAHTYPGLDAESIMCIYPFFNVKGQMQVNWLPWFPYLTKPFFALLGSRGLTFIPLVMGLLALWLTGIMAGVLDSRARGLALTAVALSSPLLFYGVTFWEHTLALVFQLAALYAVLPLGRRETVARLAYIFRLCVVVFLLLGAVMLRREAVFFAVALGGTLALQNGKAGFQFFMRWKLPVLGCALAGIGLWVVLSPWLLPERTSTDLFFAFSRLANWESLATLDTHFFDVIFLLNEGSLLPVALRWLGQAGLVICLINFFWPRARRSGVFVAGVLLILPAAFFMAFTPLRYRALHSLVLSAPFVLFALLPDTRRAARSTSERLVRMTTLLYALFYFLGTWPTHRGHGGLEWGSRYALVLFSLLAALGAVQIVRWLGAHASRDWRRIGMQGLLVLTLTVGSVSILRGVREVQRTQRDLGLIQNALLAQPLPVVTDGWWVGVSMPDLFMQHEVFTMASSDELHDWLESAGQLETSFVYASYEPISEEVNLREEGLEPIAHEVVCGMGLTTYRIGERIP